MKKMVLGLVVGMLIGTTATAFAASTDTVQGLIAKYKIIVNGKEAKLQNTPVTIKGTTYLPLRDIASLTGFTVSYKSGTISLFQNANAIPSTPTSQNQNSGTSDNQNGGVGYSRTNPAPLGTALTYKSGQQHDYSAKIKITEVIRGERAWSLIYGANRYNQPAPDGFEFVLAKVNVDLTDVKVLGSYADLWSGDFKAVSNKGVEYERQTIITPEPSYDGKIYAGASREGWIGFQVLKSDSPVLAFGRNYDGTGGIWFSIE